MERLIGKLVQDFETGGISRRQLMSTRDGSRAASGKSLSGRGCPGTGFKTVEVDLHFASGQRLPSYP